MIKYDFIILGTGAAGLSLLIRMIKSGCLHSKRVLLVDRTTKTKNDRTWCFWEKERGFFEDVVYKTWDQLCFHGGSFSAGLDIQPYRYKMIRGIDFYNYCFAIIKEHPNIEVKHGEVRTVVNNTDGTTIYIGNEELQCAPATVFNSFYNPSDPRLGDIHLLQHFKGWIIETATPCFAEDRATLMDFRVHQQHGASFVYVLPLSATKALVEYTLFTAKTLKAEQYEAELKDYIQQFLSLRDFTITEEEFGVIPMTSARFHFFEKGMYNIGIAGGQTKASTGYTFQFIQKHSQAIVDCLNTNRPLSSLPSTPGRFHFYDTVLLQLLKEQQLSGREIFTRLFQRNRASRIFKFLDNESSLVEELQLISTLQTMPFLKAALRILH
jgi:lycopene beta-cyclase